jgi:SSS family solute:Na+ symporter
MLDPYEGNRYTFRRMTHFNLAVETHFNWAVDGSIVGLYLLATMIAGVMVRKYVGKVEDFLVAGREMNVYLGIASLAATEFGIVTCMYTAQNGYDKGFSGSIVGITTAIGMFLVGWTGFCIKPLRESGVMTIPQLFRTRYGNGVQWLAGVVIVLGGLLNMGVFLRVGGEFLAVVCGFNLNKIELVMTILLVGVAVYTIMGGMLSVLITDFMQFVIMSAGLIVISFIILHQVKWTNMVNTVQTRYGDGGFNPFKHPAMGWPYVIANFVANTAAALTWQTQIARVLAAKDSKTGRKVYTGTSFFFVCRFLIPGIWGIAALTALTPAAFKVLPTHGMMAEQSLYAMPIYLSQLSMPLGMMGLLIAAMLAADMSTDSSYMLAWGSVIYNDIMAPFHKNRWTDKKGLLWNRCIVAIIGVFLLIWGLWYKLEGNLWDYLQLTGVVYLASMTSLLIAACYWKRANSWGAYASIVVGALLPVLFLFLEKAWRVPKLDAMGVQMLDELGKPATIDYLRSKLGNTAPHWTTLFTFFSAGFVMVVGSLLNPNPKPPEQPLEARGFELQPAGPGSSKEVPQ